MFDKIKKGAQASIDASKKAAEVSIEAGKKAAEVSIEAGKKAAEVSMDAGIKAKDQSIKYGKKYIRKKAIENIREKLEFAQKKESDFTKEQMRKMIAKEEKKIIKSLGITGAVTTILALFGITNI
jgi:isopropylmalate/homocitrate/citramalate synthase